MKTDQEVLAEASSDGMLGKVLGLSHTEPYSQLEWAEMFVRNLADLMENNVATLRATRDALKEIRIQVGTRGEDIQRRRLKDLLAESEKGLLDRMVIMEQVPVAIRAILDKKE